ELPWAKAIETFRKPSADSEIKAYDALQSRNPVLLVVIAVADVEEHGVRLVPGSVLPFVCRRHSSAVGH
ncbi:MAG TPA: hypothetical protein VGR26_04055, partial [Acidimicrobiales bacterium]|nr:hypothetical protein [Acidimicrobiales bacterium]